MEVVMIDRIMGAFTFKSGVYKEVEDDAAFTPTAWMIVAVVSLLSQLGTRAAEVHTIGVRWILGAIGGTIFAVIGFGLGAFVISWAGKTFFNADVTFDEVVRTLGLAYVWNAIGFLGIAVIALPALTCVTGPITFLAAIAALVAWFVAAKEALDLDWPQTIGTVLIGWVVSMIVTGIAGMILALFGLAGAGINSLFNSVSGSI
jgi:hypothetical protein